MPLFYVKKQEKTENPHIFAESVVRRSGVSLFSTAKRVADRLANQGIRAFVEEYGKGVIYTPKTKDLWVSPTK
jgi:hypothetical protein